MVKLPRRLWILTVAVSALSGAGTFHLHVEIRDSQTATTIPARVYLTDQAGKLWTPAGVITYDKREEHHFISTGSFEIDLQPGRYTLTSERGPEYRSYNTSIDARAGERQDVTIQMVRWIDMNRLGWYSGDLHNHRSLAEMPQLMLAEDLNIAPALAEWIWEDRPISTAPRTDAPKHTDHSHVYSALNEEVERLEHGPGAVDLLSLKSVIPFNGYRLYPPNDEFCRQAHAQGGYVDLEKIVWRDSAALVALGLADFAGVVHNHFNRHNVLFETDPWGMIPKGKPEFETIAGMPLWAMEVYYRYLNCGFHLPVSAGSASGVMAAPLGYNRVYVKLREPFSYESWFRELKAGRSFGTNGPMLFVTVNGSEPGSVLRFSESSPAKIHVHAEASSAGTLDRLDVIFKGRVIKTVSAPDDRGKLTVDLEYPVNETGWLAARCFERPGATIHFAQTSPVYLEVGSRRGIVAEDARFFVDWMNNEIAFYRNEPGFRSAADRAAMITFFEKARAIYEKLAQ